MKGWWNGERRWSGFQSISKLGAVKKFVAWFAIGAVLSSAIAACGGLSASQTPELTIVGYAIPKAAHDAIIPRFIEQWKQEKGQTISFAQGYGGSGAQTRAIVDGLEAHVTHLALAADTEKLAKVGLVNRDWKTQVPNGGTVAKTVVAIIVRSGNPKNIKTWDDLLRDDVKWVTADPKTSGGARWNFLALWNYALKKTGNDEVKAKEIVAKAFKNVVVLARDAREATDAFSNQGQGDALINYENEVIVAKQKGEALEYVIPDVNLSIDTSLAVVDKNVDRRGNRAVAEAFAQFMFTPESQVEFIKLGFRPLDDAIANTKENLAKYPAVKTLATIKDFGGWSKVQKKFFEDGGIFDEIRGR